MRSWWETAPKRPHQHLHGQGSLQVRRRDVQYQEGVLYGISGNGDRLFHLDGLFGEQAFRVDGRCASPAFHRDICSEEGPFHGESLFAEGDLRRDGQCKGRVFYPGILFTFLNIEFFKEMAEEK